MPVFRSSCRDCDAIFTCGGGCYWEIDNYDRNCDTGYCQYSKIMHKWLLSCLDDQEHI